ncbi:MAG: nickel pincer cofactor biosynthesis protein LarC [Candidatus Sumerlaeaceae bacterium]|nr:nickel pincer cofactor biosynthesis protein LarC [Candidatus Sumerlaeaceae bacterium]
MKSVHFDCFSGISGDMVLGAFVDLGVPLTELREALRSLPLDGYSIESRKVHRGGILATQVIVECRSEHVHRRLSDICAMISHSSLPPRTKQRAISCFQLLGEAEARVHGMPVELVHFHEVGAVDAIIDIVGSMWCAEFLGIEHATASEVVVGSGRVKTAHGELPVPAPATALLLEGVPVTSGERSGELTTPTGAAILRTLATEFGTLPLLTYEKIGYGAGSRDDKNFANCLRLFLSSLPNNPPVEHRKLVLVQTEIDDMPGEYAGYLQERLFHDGALDVVFAPIQMKKNRPGISIQCLVEIEKLAAIKGVLLRESTTFGVKVIHIDRYCLQREIHEINCTWGKIRVKIALWSGNEVLKVAPEYEDCRRIALEHGVPLPRVYDEAKRAALRWLEQRWEQGIPSTE